MKPISIIFLFYFLLQLSLPAQDAIDPFEVNTQYSFINHDINLISNNIKGLRHFYRRMETLEDGRSYKVTIVHIGDSHIQADLLSGQLRKRLHQRFGSAGRGLVFPYKVARTNSPSDIVSSSNVKWEAKRNVFPNRPLAIGASGITIRSYEPSFLLRIGVDSDHFPYKFNKVTIFNEKGPKYYDFRFGYDASEVKMEQYEEVSNAYHTVRKGESLGLISQKYGCSVSDLRSWNGIRGSTIHPGQKLVVKQTRKVSKPIDESVFKDWNIIDNSNSFVSEQSTSIYLDSLVQNLYISGIKRNAEQKEAIFYGFVLENMRESGILYNMIGVNGAKYKHYNQSEHFFDQVAQLYPDLIIVSLGTNEALGSEFNKTNFYHEVDQFITDLEARMPHACILLTIPPDGYRSYRYHNPRVAYAREVLVNYALNNDLAFWDLYYIMGGDDSMGKWRTAGLAQRDKLHFTREGYKIQGQLLYEALIKGYQSYQAGELD